MQRWEWTDTPLQEWTDSPMTEWRPSTLEVYVGLGRASLRAEYRPDRFLSISHPLRLLSGGLTELGANVTFGRSVGMRKMRLRQPGAVEVGGGFSLSLARFRLRGWSPQPMPPFFTPGRAHARSFRPLLLYDGVAVWDTPKGRAEAKATDPWLRMDYLIPHRRAGAASSISPRIGVGMRLNAPRGRCSRLDVSLIPRIITIPLGDTQAKGFNPRVGRGVLATLGTATARPLHPQYIAQHARYVTLGQATAQGFDPSVEWRPSRDLVVSKVFILELTGEAGGLTTIEIPAPSIQIRRRNGRPTVVQVSFPDDGVLEEIEARSNGDMVISQGGILANGLRQLIEITRVDLDDIRQDEGGRNSSITLTGRRTVSNADPRRVELEQVTYRSVQQGKRRYRTEVDPWIRPGDTVQVGEEEIVVGVMTYTIRTGREQMEIVEAST